MWGIYCRVEVCSTAFTTLLSLYTLHHMYHHTVDMCYVCSCVGMKQWRKTCQSFSMMAVGREATMSSGETPHNTPACVL